MRKTQAFSPDARLASVTTASNLTAEQKDQAVGALLADVLNSIDRVVAGAAKQTRRRSGANGPPRSSLRRGEIADSG